jgi:hypothetical protein
MQVLDLDDPKALVNYPQAIEIIPPNIFTGLDISSLAIRSIQEAFKTINESVLLSITQAFNVLNKNIGQIIAAQLQAERLLESFEGYYSPTQMINVEPIVNAIPLLPTISSKTRLGILMTKIGTFKYKRKALSRLSMKNAEGRILSLFMNSNLFASDEDIRKTVDAEDNREFSWVIRNLKYKFKDNGLKLILERIWDPKGYIIRSIVFLQ